MGVSGLGGICRHVARSAPLEPTAQMWSTHRRLGRGDVVSLAWFGVGFLKLGPATSLSIPELRISGKRSPSFVGDLLFCLNAWLCNVMWFVNEGLG